MIDSVYGCDASNAKSSQCFQRSNPRRGLNVLTYILTNFILIPEEVSSGDEKLGRGNGENFCVSTLPVVAKVLIYLEHCLFVNAVIEGSMDGFYITWARITTTPLPHYRHISSATPHIQPISFFPFLKSSSNPS